MKLKNWFFGHSGAAATIEEDIYAKTNGNAKALKNDRLFYAITKIITIASKYGYNCLTKMYGSEEAGSFVKCNCFSDEFTSETNNELGSHYKWVPGIIMLCDVPNGEVFELSINDHTTEKEIDNFFIKIEQVLITKAVA